MSRNDVRYNTVSENAGCPDSVVENLMVALDCKKSCITHVSYARLDVRNPFLAGPGYEGRGSSCAGIPIAALPNAHQRADRHCLSEERCLFPRCDQPS